MKSVIFLACVFVGANALDQALLEELMMKIQEYGIDCAESEKATPEDIEALMNRQPPVTHEGRCVVFCVSKKLKLMNEDGSVAKPKSEWMDKVKADDPELFEKIKKIYEVCSQKVEDKPDGCDVALDLASCAKSESEKVGLDKLLV